MNHYMLEIHIGMKGQKTMRQTNIKESMKMKWKRNGKISIQNIVMMMTIQGSLELLLLMGLNTQP